MALKIGELVGFLKINRTDWARGIDYAKRSLVTLGAHVAAVGRANGLILLAATGIQAAAAIAPVSGALLVIPAAAAVAGVALGAVKAATAGMGDAMRAVASGDAAALEEALTKLSPAARAFVRSWAGLRDGFKPIQQAVQERFFLGLDQDLRAFTKSTLPGLRAGLEPTADALNGLAREGVQAASTPLFSGLLAQVGTSSARSLGALQGVVRLLVATVANAAKVGLPLVERLSAMAGAALRARLAFWGSAAGADAMRATLDRGAATMGRLTSIAGSLAATLAGVFGAAGLAGAKDLLGTVDQLAARMAAWVNSASGQDALQGWFASMADLGSRVVDVAGQVFDVLALVLGVMDSLPGPVQGAVTQFVAWSIVLGPIVGRLVGVGGAVLTLVGHLGKGIAAAYRWLFAHKLAAGGTRAAWLATKVSVVASWVTMAATATVSAARTAAIATAAAIRAAAVWVASHATMLASTVVTAAGVVAGWVLMGVQSMIQAARMAAAWLIAMGPAGWVIAAVIGLVALIIANWDTVKTITAAVWNWIWTNVIQPVWEFIKAAVQAGVQLVIAYVSFWRELPGRVAGWFGAIKDWIVTKFNEAVDFVRSVPGRILGALGNLGNLLKGAGKAIIQGLIDGIKEMASKAVSAVTSVAQQVRDVLPFSPAKRGPFAGRGYTLHSGRALIRDWAAGLLGQRAVAVDAIGTVMGAAAGQIPSATGLGLAGLPASAGAGGSRDRGGPVFMLPPNADPFAKAMFAWLQGTVRKDFGGSASRAFAGGR